MEPALVLGVAGVAGGAALAVGGVMARAKARDQELADVLGLPYGEGDLDVARLAAENGPVVSGALGLANTAIDRLGSGDLIRKRLERADLSIRPSELVVVAAALGLAVGLAVAAVTQFWWIIAIVLLITPVVTTTTLDVLANRRAKRFNAQLPDALGLISSSLSAGHTFLRSIQLMADEFDKPLSDEFRRVVSETQLGAPLVDSLERMGQRLQLRDVDWMIQAIRIQQQVGGHLADLLATLADFMRAREEVRREVNVLTAEGRISAWVLGAMPVFLFLAVQVINPGYLEPMLQGWGLFWLGLTCLSMAIGVGIILRMVKSVEV